MRSIYICWFLLVLFCGGCSSPERTASGEDSSEDTSYYHPAVNPSATFSKSQVDTIRISDMKFVPDEIKVHKGDTIIWINNDLVVHCVTELNMKSWTSYPIPAGASWKKAINSGSDYYCAIHQVMKGRIILEETPLSSLQ